MKSTWRKRKKRFVKIHMESKKKKLKKFIKDKLITINEQDLCVIEIRKLLKVK